MNNPYESIARIANELLSATFADDDRERHPEQKKRGGRCESIYPQEENEQEGSETAGQTAPSHMVVHSNHSKGREQEAVQSEKLNG